MYFWRDEADFMNDIKRVSTFYSTESCKNTGTKTKTQVSKKKKPVTSPWYESDSEEEKNFYSFGRGRKYEDSCTKYEDHELQEKIQMQVRHTVGNRYSNEALEAYYNVCKDDDPDITDSPILAPKEVSIEFARQQKQLETYNRADLESNNDVYKDDSSGSGATPKKLSTKDVVVLTSTLKDMIIQEAIEQKQMKDDVLGLTATPKKMSIKESVGVLKKDSSGATSASSCRKPKRVTIKEDREQKQMKDDVLGLTSAPKKISIKEAREILKKQNQMDYFLGLPAWKEDSSDTSSASSCRMPKRLTIKEAREQRHVSPEDASDARPVTPFPSSETVSIKQAKEQEQIQSDDSAGSEEASDTRTASPCRSPERALKKQEKREWHLTRFKKSSVANNIEISCSKLAEEKFCSSSQSSPKKKNVQDRLNRR